MPTLFISYKRGTAGINPLRERLAAAHYRIWYDKDSIHSGDDWQESINQGIDHSDAVIVGLTAAACASEYVQYEVKRAQEKGKPIFPVKMEAMPDTDLEKLGLEKIHYRDFTSTDPDGFNKPTAQLLADLAWRGLPVTRHDRRQQRDNKDPVYLLHQRYLKQLTERIGTLNLAQIDPEGRSIELERVYVHSPVGLGLSVEVQDWRVVDWWIDDWQPIKRGGLFDLPISEQYKDVPLRHAANWGFEDAPLLTLVGQIDGDIGQYRQAHPKLKPDKKLTADLDRNDWCNGEHRNIARLDVGDIAAVRNRLVILGGPGSGKSTFVRHLALCLAGAQIDGWTRPAMLETLGIWSHGPLTPIYVELRRFVSSAQYPTDYKANPTTDALWQYIEAELRTSDLASYAADLKSDLEQGSAVLILDGLDEVPYDENRLPDRQRQLRELAASLTRSYPHSRIIVASRPYAYEGWKLPGFESITLSAYEYGQRQTLAKRLYHVAGLAPDEASEKAQALNTQLASIDPELKDRPLFVTLMATIFLHNAAGNLPTRRGGLYRQSILLLLDRWTKTKPDVRSLLDILGGTTVDELLERLGALAYDVHETYGEKPGTPEIDYNRLFDKLKPIGKHTAVDLITYLSANSGVLVCPGQNIKQDIFHFAHRSFQEYLAAREIVRRCQEADSFVLLRDLIQAKPQVWREPGRLVADVLVENAHERDLWTLVGDLLGDDLPTNVSATDTHWWSLWLAAAIAEEHGMADTKAISRSDRLTREFLRDYARLLIETVQALPPVERALCGRVLGMIGDPRPGVGLRADGLPDIVWCEVPGGEFIHQGSSVSIFFREGTKRTLPTFYMAKYQITYAQFQAFIDAPDGFRNPQWWNGLRREWLNQQKGKLGAQSWPIANHPRENVSWYDAMAFCRWLSAKLGYSVRLPTGEEWEKAASDTDGRVYSYGDKFDKTKGNTRETGIGQTSAVGIFPDPALPYGLFDMVGNVCEWTLTERKSFDNEEDQSSCGGSWNSSSNGARAANRDGWSSDSRYLSLGFRVCCGAVPVP